jgi:hypothetical protein
MTLVSLFFSPALACGGFAPQSGALAASDAQQALFDLGAESISVTYRAHYTGNADDFAWVLAVPGRVDAVAEGDGDRLDAIALASTPQVEIDPAVDSGGGCGCGAQSKGGLTNDRAFGGDTGVEVTGSGLAGDYAYTTLAASDADGLVQWLTDHGYDVSLLEDAIAAYVADPLDYEFVAVQLVPDAPDVSDNGVDLVPLQITYGPASDGALHAVFPAKLGATSSVETVRTEIFVLGEGTAALSGWDPVANPDEADGHTWDAVAPDYHDPSGVYYQHLLAYGGAQRRMWLAFADTYSDEGTERWLTRYDAIVFPATNSVDPVFTDSDDHTPASTVIYLMEESAFEDAYPGDTAAVLVVGLVGLLGWRRKTRA